jgi:hypothetical protein
MKIRDSKTIKFKHNGADHAVYLTIVFNQDDKVDALFVNSKEMGAFQWISALMTSYSRQLASGIQIEALIADMKETFDPNGSYFIEDGSNRQVNSIIHHMALIIEEYVL